MEALEIHTSASTVHWEDNTSCISVVDTPTVKHLDIPLCFLLQQFDNGLFVKKYDNYSVMPADMCTKPCPGSIISRSNKWMTGLRLYPTSDTEHYQLIILQDYVVE